MKQKLIMIWHLLRSEDYIVIADKITHVDASTEIVGRTVAILVPILMKEAVKTKMQMDSAVDEVNNIINGIK